MPNPVRSDKNLRGRVDDQPSPGSSQQEPTSRNPKYSMPRGFEKLLHHEDDPPTPPRRKYTRKSYHLHVRQQPTAARACSAGDRDRRLVDPPPIVQILLSDFDPESSDDRDILQDPRFTVGCLLLPVLDSSSRKSLPECEQGRRRERDRESDGVAEDTFSTPTLSGKAFTSPFYVEADPDPNSAPTHPYSHDPTSKNFSFSGSANPPNSPELPQPATFFVFADLSVSSAGLYRLQFRLMNWGSAEDTGQSMPILAEDWSDPFRVYTAKDFPGMRDSSILADGLKESGCMEIKIRGNGKGKGRKR